MKKQIGLLFGALLIVTLLSAQNEDFKSTITGGVGFTLSGALVKAVEDASLGEVKSSGIPNLEIAYDYGITKWFSIGAMAAYQKLTLKENINGGVSKYSVSRIYFGSSMLFHYANSGRVDLFSGIRIGYKNWSSESDLVPGAQDVGIQDITFFGDGISYQVLLFGIRGYVTENSGLNVEVLSIGTPHIASAGISYRF